MYYIYVNKYSIFSEEKRMIPRKLIFSVVFLSIAWLEFVTADEDHEHNTEVESDDSFLSSFLSHNNSLSPFFAPAGSAGKYKTVL